MSKHDPSASSASNQRQILRQSSWCDSRALVAIWHELVTEAVEAAVGSTPRRSVARVYGEVRPPAMCAHTRLHGERHPRFRFLHSHGGHSVWANRDHEVV